MVDHARQLGLSAYRYPCWLGTEQLLAHTSQVLINHDIGVVAVLDRRAFTDSEWRNNNFKKRMKYWYNILPMVKRWQILNEVDNPGYIASGHKRVNTVKKALMVAQSVFTGCEVLPPGLVKIDIRYLNLPTSKQCFHIYGSNPEIIGTIASKPVIVTEFPGTQPWLLPLLEAEQVEEAFVYCLPYAQDPELSLLDSDWGAKPEYWAVANYAHGL